MSAPFIDLPTTPAREWAENTTDALKASNFDSIPAAATTDTRSLEEHHVMLQPDGRHAAIPHFASTTSTPGPALPGAFPKGESTIDGIKPEEAVIQAKQTVVVNVSGLLENAKQYLPESVASYFPYSGPDAGASENIRDSKSISLPTSEVHGDTSGTSGGVGPLPGDVYEESVAKLPEQRARDGSLTGTTEIQNENTHPIQTTSNTIASSTQPDPSTPPTSHAGDSSAEPDAKRPKASETPAATPTKKTGGVGDLLRSASESSVALLPEERQTQSSDRHQELRESQVPDVNTQSGAPDSLLSAMAVDGQSPTETPRYTTTRSNAANQPEISEELAMKPLPNPNQDKQNRTPNDLKAPSESSGDQGSDKAFRKNSLVSKIKGEVKILSGKIGKNEEKVEEGKRLLGKV